MTELSELLLKLTESKKILNITHLMPDGDAISSVATLTMALKKLGKSTIGVIDDRIPPEYFAFPGVEDLIGYDRFLEMNFTPDLIVVLDCSSPDRVGRFSEVLSRATVVVIDHHQTNGFFGDMNWVDSSYAATAQMVLELNMALNVEYDENLAMINYVGLATDSGFFKYSNTTAKLLKDASKLVELGAKPYFVASTILENKTPNQFLLLSKMIERMKIEDRIAYSVLTFEDYVSCGCTDQDSTGFVSELRSLRDIEVAMIVIEYPKGRVHVSLRSKNIVDVSKIAATLGGGGHARAAGCSFESADPWIVLNEVLTHVRNVFGGFGN